MLTKIIIQNRLLKNKFLLLNKKLFIKNKLLTTILISCIKYNYLN